MTRDQRGLTQGSHLVGMLPCPCGNPDHAVLKLTEDEARLAGLPAGQPVHIDRTRQATTGDLVWVELVRYGSTQRIVRRYARDSGWVTLSAPGGGSAAVMRRQGELLVLGVVDDTATCSSSG